MKLPRFVEKMFLGRKEFSDTAPQPDGEEHPLAYYRQKHVNMCGDACVLMFSDYYGWDGLAKGIDMNTNPRGVTDGLEIEKSEECMRYLDDLTGNFQNGDIPGKFKAEVQKYPLIVSGMFAQMGVMGTNAHWVILKGWSGGDVYLHDPWHGANRKMSAAEFANKFNAATEYQDTAFVFAANATRRDPNAFLLRLGGN